jgi:hypothetical protein
MAPIFSSELWRTFWISIRRSRKDRSDRKAALRFVFVLLFSVLYYGRILWIGGFESGDKGTLLLYGIAAFLVITATAGLWISKKFDSRKAVLHQIEL